MGAKFNGFLFICVLVAVLYFFDNLSHDIVNNGQQISFQGKVISYLYSVITDYNDTFLFYNKNNDCACLQWICKKT